MQPIRIRDIIHMVIRLKRLYEGNLVKNFITFSIPLILASLMAQTHNLVDTAMVGRLIGDSALAAVGSTSPLLTLISSMIWGYGAGSAIYTAQLFGEGNNKKAVNATKIAMLTSATLCICVAIIFVSAREWIFDALNISESIAKDAFSYFAIYSFGLVFLQINSAGVYFANAFGMSNIAFAASVISCVLNIAGNYISIAVLGLGVAGAAMATVFASFVVAIYYLIQFSRIFKKIGCSLRGLEFSLKELKANFVYGFPNMLQQSVMYLSTTIVSPLVNTVGTSAIAGYTAGMKVYDVNAAIYQNSNKTITNYVAHCCGAKKHDIISRGVGIGLIMTLCYLAIPLTPTVFASRFTAGLFFSADTAAQSMEYAVFFLRCCMPFVVFNVLNNAFHAIFRGSGSGRYLVYSTLVYAVARVAYSYVLFARFGIYGIFVAVPLAWVTEAIFGSVIYFSGKWKNASQVN